MFKLYSLMQRHISVDGWYEAAKPFVPKGKGPMYTLQVAADRGLIKLKHASGEELQATKPRKKLTITVEDSVLGDVADEPR